MPLSTSLIPTACPARRFAEIDFLAIEAEAAAAGDDHRPVVERIVRFGNAVIGPSGGGVELGRAFHGERFVRAFVVKFLNEGVELCLLLQDIGASRTGGLLLQSQMHAFVPAVLLRMTGPNAFDGDAQP